jgi:hypothetical protein
LTAFSSSDESAGVDANGLAESRQTGEAAILCRYLSIIGRAPHVSRTAARFVWSNPLHLSMTWTGIFGELKMLNILPADLCTDQDRSTGVLDLGGILPTDECRIGRYRARLGARLIDLLSARVRRLLRAQMARSPALQPVDDTDAEAMPTTQAAQPPNATRRGQSGRGAVDGQRQHVC